MSGMAPRPDPWLADQPDIARRNRTASATDGFCAALVVGLERVPNEGSCA